MMGGGPTPASLTFWKSEKNYQIGTILSSSSSLPLSAGVYLLTNSASHSARNLACSSVRSGLLITKIWRLSGKKNKNQNHVLCTAGLFYIKTILFTRKKILVLHKNNIPLKNKIAINFSNFPTELLNAIDAPKIFFMVFFRMIDLLVSIKC